MAKHTYTGPVDTLEIQDPKDPQKTIFSEHLHPGRSYELPAGDHQVIANMIGRGLFVPSPVTDTSPSEPAPAKVAGKRS
ncbi:hypothetical protein ABE438_14685 [Bosea sp. TWI1241]|uniref:hypothetical protein n=1 Tax=Bosea sp. TWI1241 TaxID=3148904 RepID=UPI00320A6B3C